VTSLAESFFLLLLGVPLDGVVLGAGRALQIGHDDAVSLVKKEKRSNEFWLAIASSIVALIVGVIAAGSGWYTANHHDEQETIRQKVSFTRSQQKEAYAAFINSASDLAMAIQLQVEAIQNRYPYFPYVPLLEGREDLKTSYTDFAHATNLAQLYGSSRVRDESNKVFDAAMQSRSTIADWEMNHPANGPNNASCPEVLAFVNETEFVNRQQLGNAIDRFNDAAREDLDISSLPPTSPPSQPPLPNDACVVWSQHPPPAPFPGLPRPPG
jgi:hypothetical protein